MCPIWAMHILFRGASLGHYWVTRCPIELNMERWQPLPCLGPKSGCKCRHPDQLQQEYREDSRPLKAAPKLTKRLAYRYFQTLGTGNVERQSQDFVVQHEVNLKLKRLKMWADRLNSGSPTFHISLLLDQTPLQHPQEGTSRNWKAKRKNQKSKYSHRK